MTCFHCRTEFCWLCGERIYAGHVGYHYELTNIFGCGGLWMQGEYRVNMGNRSAKMCMYVRRAMRLICMLPYLAPYWALLFYLKAPCMLVCGAFLPADRDPCCGMPPTIPAAVKKLVRLSVPGLPEAALEDIVKILHLMFFAISDTLERSLRLLGPGNEQEGASVRTITK